MPYPPFVDTSDPRWVGPPELGIAGPVRGEITGDEFFLIVVATDRLHSPFANQCFLKSVTGPGHSPTPMLAGTQSSVEASMFPDSGYSTYQFSLAVSLDDGVWEALEAMQCPYGDRLVVGPYRLTFRVSCKEPCFAIRHDVEISIELFKVIEPERLRAMRIWRVHQRERWGE